MIKTFAFVAGAASVIITRALGCSIEASIVGTLAGALYCAYHEMRRAA